MSPFRGNCLLALAALFLLAACSTSLPTESQIDAATPSVLESLQKRLTVIAADDPEEPEPHYLLARTLLRAGQPEQAETSALQAARYLPFDGAVSNLLGEIYLARNKRFRALTAFSQAVEFEPDLLPAYVNLAVTHQLLGEPAAALTALKEALRRESSYYPAQLRLAQLQLTAGKLKAAERAIVAARRIRPQALQALVEEIRVRKAQGHLSIGLLLAEEGLVAHPGQPALLREKLDIHVQRRQWPEALSLLRRMDVGGGLATEDALVMVEVLLARGELPAAEALLEELRRREPRDAGVLLAVAKARIVRNDPAGALAVLDGVVEHQPESWQGHYWKAQAHYQLGQDSRGDAELGIAARLAPGYGPVQLMRIRRLAVGRKFQQARQLLNSYLASRPADGNALLVRSELRMLIGDYAGAEKDLDEIVSTGKRDALQFARARLAYLRGEFRAVLEHTAMGTAGGSTPWQLVYLRGAALLRLRRGAEARAMLTPFLRGREGGGNFHRLLGDIHYLSGDRTAAEQVYIQGLSRFPRQPRLVEALTRLAIEDGRWAQARDWLEGGIERDSPQLPMFLERLSQVYRKLGDEGRARRYLQRYLAETDPLIRGGRAADEAPNLFNTAFPVVGYGIRRPTSN